MPAILRTYLRRLSNLSSRNKSLWQPKLRSGHDVDWLDLDFRLNQPAISLLQQVLSGKPEVRLCTVHDPRDSRSNVLSRALRRLARTVRLLEEEQGSHDLALGWLYLRGRFVEGSPVQAPLVLLPMRLSEENGFHVVRPAGEGPQVNKTLLLAYAQYQGISLPEEVLEVSMEDWPRDLQGFTLALYEWVKAHELALHFNSELFAGRLDPFLETSTADHEQAFAPGQLKLFPWAVLGLFSQADPYLLPDYQQLLAEGREPENLFPSPETDTQPWREERILDLLPLDGSQSEALRRILQGQSYRVQGPPGTGKSQLITSLLANAMAQGKRVLFVSQKKAALDVVEHRLRSLGLGDFLAVVHDIRQDRAGLYAQLARQIENLEDMRLHNARLDAVWLEREFSQVCRRIEHLETELEAYRQALFDSSRFGISPKELYLRQDGAVMPALQGPWMLELDENRLSDWVQTWEVLKRLHEELGWKMPHFGTLARPEIHTWGLNERQAFREALQGGLAQWLAEGQALWGAGWSEETNWQASLAAAETALEQVAAYAQPLNRFPTWTTEQEPIWNALLSQDWSFWPECREESALMARIQVLEEALALRARWAGGIRWALAGTLRRELAQFASLEAGPEAWQKLLNQARRQVEALRHWQGLSGQAPSPSPSEWRQWQEAWALWQSWRAIEPWGPLWQRQGLEATQTWAETARRWSGQWSHYLGLFSLEACQALALEPGLAPLWLAEWEANWDNLQAYDQRKAALGSLERQSLPLLLQHQAEPEALRQSTWAYWLEHLEQSKPALRQVDTLDWPEKQAELSRSLARKAELSQEILGQSMRAVPTQGWQYNRLGHRTTYRDLLHQVSKKRKLWPVRRLLAELGDEVFRLAPCWMASPEAVSALFPLAPLFDWVVFDEASQCRAEKGVPALVRGKHLVIAGDSRQLPPQNLYQVRWEEEGDTHPDAEAESLLDLAQGYLPEIDLQGHYRSRWPELIAFSNQAFYRNRLDQVPPKVEGTRPPALAYHHIREGLWERQQNRPEAEALCARVWHYLDQGQSSLGVVTFNAPQQELIAELLSAQSLERNQPLPERLFVKNLVNVQGDERDVILFSLVHGPDRFNHQHAQWGLLGQQGGERYLNVAITRARERMEVFASFRPGEMPQGESAGEGVRQLAAWLAFVEEVGRQGYESAPGTVSASQVSLARAWQEQGGALPPPGPFAEAQLPQGPLLHCDDERYRQAARPRDWLVGLPQRLAAAGWASEWAWSRSWWHRAKKST